MDSFRFACRDDIHVAGRIGPETPRFHPARCQNRGHGSDAIRESYIESSHVLTMQEVDLLHGRFLKSLHVLE